MAIFTAEIAIHFNSIFIYSYNCYSWHYCRITQTYVQSLVKEGAQKFGEIGSVRSEVLEELGPLIEHLKTLKYDYICNGKSGWRQVAFINMTDAAYDCLTSHSKGLVGDLTLRSVHRLFSVEGYH